MICPKNDTLFGTSHTYQNFYLRLASLIRQNTCSRLLRCSSNDFGGKKLCRLNIPDICQANPANTLSISLSNVAGASQSPNGVTLNYHIPPPWIEKATFSASLGDIPNCQNPDLQSSALNHQFIYRIYQLLARVDCLLQLYSTVINFRISQQKRTESLDFVTIKTKLLHGLVEG